MTMFKKLLSVVLITFLSTSIHLKAQEVFEGPSKPLTKVKFTQLTGGVILLSARIDSTSEILRFILDTGSSGISLDSTTVSQLGFKVTEPSLRIKGVGGFVDVGFVKNKNLWIGDHLIDSLNFHVIDYSMLTAKYGSRIDGIIGYSVFSRYIVKINYDDTTVTLCTNGSIKYPRGGHMIFPHIGKLPVAHARVSDDVTRRFNYIFDIGAGLTVLFSDDYIRDSALLKSKRKKYIKLAEGLGGTIDMNLTMMKELRIGPYRFKNIPINYFDDSVNVTNYPVLGGIVGNDILRRFNVILNYDKKQIYIKPNKSFDDLFDYAYSGLEIFSVDKKIYVGEVPKNSPAELAGVKSGDQIMSINKKLGLDINEMKAILQNNIGTVEVIVHRDGELFQLKMKVVDIRTGKYKVRATPVKPIERKSPLNFETSVW